MTIKYQLIKHLQGGMAFNSLDSFIDNIPFEKLGERPQKLPYSFYELFYHVQFAQRDILEYITSDSYTDKNWPEDYWPDTKFPEDIEEWEKLKEIFFQDRLELEEYLENPENDLEDPIKNSEKHTLLREVLLVVEHNAYHIGQMLLIQRLLGVYK